MFPAARHDPCHIFCTDWSLIGQKLTYRVQSSLKMRTLRVKILQRFLVLNQHSMWTTAWMLSRQSYLTHSHLPIFWNLVCKALFNMLQISSGWMESSCVRTSKAITRWSYQERSVIPSSPKRMRQSVIGPFFPPSHTLGSISGSPCWMKMSSGSFQHAILVRLGRLVTFTCHQLSLTFLCFSARST